METLGRMLPDTRGPEGPGVIARLAGLAADDCGESDDRPPIVLLHGLTFDRQMWRPALDVLARIDPARRAVALDLPGHGDSPGWPAYDVERFAEGVHRAVVAAELRAPVVVGHSMSAIIATVYAARYPTRGVINVDQSLEVERFARLVQSLAAQLRGPQFPAIWETFRASMHAEVLPPAAQALVTMTTRPRQELVVGYWYDALARDPDELGAWAAAVLGQLRAGKTPYLVISGTDLDPAYTGWLGDVLPQARVEVWPASGHFPHLAHPDRFARVLAAGSAS